MYTVNTARTGHITEREVRRSNLLEAFHLVDEEEDINRVTQYFSYEHFYVLYCRYWELDTDHDGVISRDDLLRYGGHRLSRAIVDRIFEVGHRPSPVFPPIRIDSLHQQRSSDSLGGLSAEGATPHKAATTMHYDDFVYFMLSEEDKGNKASLQYWFSCVDIDGDGKITPRDMRFFYDVQTARMESLGHDVVNFSDVLCQMSDMIKPSEVSYDF